MIKLGTHGEDYGNWMSNPVIYAVGGIAAIALLLSVLSFTLFAFTLLGILFALIFLVFIILLCWVLWIRREYSFSHGGVMEKAYENVLSHLDFKGDGRILDVGCGSGALSIRAALTWKDAEVVGLDYWGAIYNYSKALCEKNADSEGVGNRCTFVRGDANKLDFPDESFDAVISNYVYHNITGSDKRTLLKESLRVLKKGGVFALNDDMKEQMYGDMNTFVEELKNMGYEDVRLVDTASEIFGSKRNAALHMLGSSMMIVGRK